MPSALFGTTLHRPDYTVYSLDEAVVHVEGFGKGLGIVRHA